jgi:3-hydroxyisobutyrate dehydrogenase-like beta-hydroxyacid dehydrogenase
MRGHIQFDFAGVSMSKAPLSQHSIGWIGTGRMGLPMATRLLKAGCRLSVYNRTRAKAEPLVKLGATQVDSPAGLAGCDIVFTMVLASKDLLDVTTGKDGLLTDTARAPKILVDCSTVSEEASGEARDAAAKRGTRMIAAPVSGNGRVVQAGKLSLVCSGPRDAYDEVLPYLEAIGGGVTYVGEGDISRMVKICHNVFLGVLIQALSEVTVLAEKRGVPRHAFLDFINKSVIGSIFTRYKTPAFVNLDFTAAFPTTGLRKDLDLGLDAARALEVAMPYAAAARENLQTLVGHGHGAVDFAAMILLQAQAAGLDLKSENQTLGDGLDSGVV